MSKASDAGKSFLAGVFAKLTPEQRTQAEAIFNSADATPALEVLGTGALAQPEISRQLDTLRSQREELEARQTELTNWFTENEAALKEYVVIKPDYDKLKGTKPVADPPPATGFTKEEIAAELERRDRSFAGALALSVNLAQRHLQAFNEVLDMNDLLADPKLGTVTDRNSGKVYGLQDAYDTKHGERVRTKATEAETARIQKLVDAGVAERMRATPHPFPLRDSSPSPLDALTVTDRKPDSYTVDSAVETYEKLQQVRSA